MAWIQKLSRAPGKQSVEDLIQQKEQLQVAVDRYNRIFMGSRGYGFVDWDLLNERMHWDGAFWESLGYSQQDMDHISDSNHFLEYVHPDDREIMNNAIRGQLKNQHNGDVTCRIRRKKGGYIWAEFRTSAVRDENGWVSFMSGIAFDVTKLKQTEQALLISEARHARIIKSSNDGIWEWSADHGGFHFSNRCWEQLGYTEHDDVVNQGIDRVQAWRARMHPDDGEVFDKVLRDHIRGKRPFDIEYRIKGKDDEWRWIRARGQMTYNEKGEPKRMSGTNMDITQLKNAEERVIKAKEAAEKANRAKSEFLSSMSHELRTPLNAILGFAQLFELDSNLNSDQQANVEEIKKAGHHLLQLISDVLDLAKVEAGRMSFSLEEMTPIRLLKECVVYLKPQAAERDISITAEYNGLDEQTICADCVRYKQVLLNLISNAVKYNRDGGAVHITCSITLDEQFRLTVKDTGIGIPTEYQNQLFQPFNRLSAENSHIEGTGVGLVITKQLVEHMGGQLGFASQESIGSEFWVEFPVQYEQANVSARERTEELWSSDVNEIPELEITTTKKILYVEDNPPNQRLMQQILARYPQLQLEVAGESLRGIYLARTSKPDMIILDINLPGMDGFETLDVLKKDPQTEKIPVIALSANAMAHDIKRGEQSGFATYLTKPVEIGKLIATCNQLLRDD